MLYIFGPKTNDILAAREASDLIGNSRQGNEFVHEYVPLRPRNQMDELIEGSAFSLLGGGRDF